MIKWFRRLFKSKEVVVRPAPVDTPREVLATLDRAAIRRSALSNTQASTNHRLPTKSQAKRIAAQSKPKTE